MSDVLEIRMQSRGQTTCYVCGGECSLDYGVPVVNGDVISNEFPDWLWGQIGGGVPSCERCYTKHWMGELPTFDRYYIHLARDFIGGLGI